MHSSMILNDPKKMIVTLSMANKVEQSGTKCPSHIDMLPELEEETPPKKNMFKVEIQGPMVLAPTKPPQRNTSGGTRLPQLKQPPVRAV